MRKFLIVILLAVCGTAAAQTKLTVAHGLSADFLPAFIAKEEGLFAKNGLDVSLATIANTSLVPPALTSGSAQIGTLTVPNLLLAADSGLDQVAVAGGARLLKSNPHMGTLARPGFTFTKASDLKGHRIGVPGINGAQDLFLKKWLLDNGVALRDVTIVETFPAQMSDILKGGQVDVLSVFEPLLTRIASSGAGVRSVDYFSEVNPDVLGALWASTREWASANRRTVSAFRTSMEQALAFIKANPQRAKQIEAKYLGFPSPGWPDYTMAVQPADFEFFVKVMSDLGVTRKPINASRLVFQ